MTGKIKTLVRDRKFGFIAVEGQAKDLFFHAKEMKNDDYDSLNEGDTLSFDIVEGPKGPSATNVVKA